MQTNQAQRSPVPGLLAAPIIAGTTLAVALVAGLAIAGNPLALVVASERGLGALMLAAALAGLFGCAVFGTSLVAGDADEPRGRPGAAVPVPVLPARRRIR